MRRKGFTLIELLAVIIILAIITLITTPIVMRGIENSKKGVAERSAENYVKAVETTIVTERMNGNTIQDGLYILDSNGDVCLDEDCANKLIITMTGTKPSSGKVKIEGEKVIGYSVIIGEYKNKYGNYSILPSEYQEVEYLESTGTQYIDTGIYFSNMDLIFESKLLLDISQSGYWGVFGAQDVRPHIIRLGRVWWYGNTTSYATADININDGVLHNIIANKDGITVDSVLYNINPSSTSINLEESFLIFKVIAVCKCKMYYLLIRENNNILYNFIPCYRRSDDEPGMYDTVNGVFYTNAGTGTFVVGNDV